MKGIVIAAGMTLAAATLAAQAQQAPSRPATVPPPPGMNAPGVKDNASATTDKATPTQGLQDMRKLLDQAAQVDVHRKDGNVIEEYRRNGRIYMVRVTPPRGVTQTYMVDPDGKLRSVSGGPPVSPVMYKILDFGRPPAASEEKDSGNHNDG